MKKIKTTGDGIALTFQKHPRNSILGASLVLETMFPKLSRKKINELAPYLAQEFQETFERGKQEKLK